MTASELEKAHQIARRAKEIADLNRRVIGAAQKQEAQLDRVLATSEIKSDEYRRVLRRAGLLKP